MNSFGFLFVFLFSVSSQADMQCVDLFKVDKVITTNNSSSPKILDEMAEDFLRMNIYERQETLDYVIVALKKEMVATRPGVFQRFFTEQGRLQQQAYSELKSLYIEAKQIQENYRLVRSLLHGTVKNHNLSKGDEIQLLNRLLDDTSILPALKFLNRRQIRLNGKDRLEQYFIDSVVVYLAWGPDPKMFPVPINNWLIFDIFLGHKDAKYMVNMALRFKSAAKMYKNAKQGLNKADAIIEDYSLSRQDPVFEIIEKTEKKDPGVIERLLEQEINNGHVIYNQDGVLDIVDDSL
ncbi:hypothetical protein K2X05_08990, partial [bacterium]|nr:hypothetical protein [bacterium]